MKKLCLILVLLPALSLLAFGPQATEKAAGSAETKTAAKSGKMKAKRVGHPVDIDITADPSGKPTAPDVTLHRANDDRARWNNKVANRDCDVIFSPFGLPNYMIPRGRSATSGPIVGPDGRYEYVIVCGAAKTVKERKAKPGDPAIIVTN